MIFALFLFFFFAFVLFGTFNFFFNQFPHCPSLHYKRRHMPELDLICGICRDPLTEGQRYWACKARCQKLFHEECVEKSLGFKGRCPSCRATATKWWCLTNTSCASLCIDALVIFVLLCVALFITVCIVSRYMSESTKHCYEQSWEVERTVRWACLANEGFADMDVTINGCAFKMGQSSTLDRIALFACLRDFDKPRIQHKTQT